MSEESKLVDVACHVLNDKSIRLQNTDSRRAYLRELFSFQRNPLMVQVVPGIFGPKVVICNHYDSNQDTCDLTDKPCYLLHNRAYPLEGSKDSILTGFTGKGQLQLQDLSS